MEYNFDEDVKLFMIFDILGDTVRSGMIQWQIERERLEDVNNHILDLILIAKILKKYLPTSIDMGKIIDYIIVHDLPEAITGDITKFEGISDDEINRVTKLAMDYIITNFGHIIDFANLMPAYEEKRDLESKIVKMIDKVHSATTFIKYQAEKDIDMNKPTIMHSLRYNPFVDKMINEGYDLADMFYEFHIKAICFSDEELIKYNISREEADKITFAIRSFAEAFYNQKKKATLFDFKKDFPEDAMIYNRRRKLD